MTDRLAAALVELGEAFAEALADRPQNGDAAPRLVSIDEAAGLLGVSRTSLYAAIRRGEIRSHKLGKRRLIASAEVARVVGQFL